MTFSKQKIKTWPNILQLAGCAIIDVGGPAVSNQWIINKTFLGLQQHPDIKTAIIQLTGLEKLDVEVDQEKINKLVKPDPLRNFVIDSNFQINSTEQIGTSGIWPSSGSEHHESKKLWRKWLFSPTLEKEELYCKLLLLDNYCQQHHINLCVYQGYDISWSEQQIVTLQKVIKNISASWHSEYVKSPHYQPHENIISSLGYQIELACVVGKNLSQIIQNKLTKFKSSHDQTRQDQ